MQFMDKDQTWETDIHNKEHEITKIIHTKQQNQMSNLESQVQGRHKRKGKL